MKNVFLLVLFFLSSCSRLLYYPDQRIYGNPEYLNLDYKSEMFETADGAKLHAWLTFPLIERDNSVFIAHFHGNAQNLTSHFFNLAWMSEIGHYYWIFDYRGYGQSQSQRPTPKSTIKDGVAALETAYHHYLESSANHFVVYGQSLGGIVLMRSIEEFEYRDQIDLVILDSTFDSYREIAKMKAKDNFITWPLWPLTQIFFSDRYAPQEFYQINKTPTLLIHSKEDPVVPYHFAQKIYSKLRSEKWIWSLDQREHGGAFHRYGEGGIKYRKKLVTLLNELFFTVENGK